jgi:hypothetical protein
METISGAGLTSSRDAGVTATSLGICDSRSRTSAGPDFGKKPGRRPKAISAQNKGEEDIWTLEFQGTFGPSGRIATRRIRVYSLFIRQLRFCYCAEEFVKKLSIPLTPTPKVP